MLEPRLIELLEEFFAIEDVHIPANLIPVRKKLLDFLRIEENILASVTDANLLVAKDLIRLIDAYNIYTTTSNRMSSSDCIQPLFDRLLTYSEWSYYDLAILADALMFAPTAEFAIDFGAKSIMPLVNVRLAASSDIIQAKIASSICSRLLYAKYFDDEVTADLDEKFMTWFKKLERLAENNQILARSYLHNQVRHALFYQNQEEIFRLCNEVKKDTREQNANSVISTVGFYTSSQKYNAMLHEGVSN